jgi:hypothetical protein
MRVLAIAGACVACGGAVEVSKIEVDDSVFISSNESALKYPQTGVHLLCQNRSHQKTSEFCPPPHLFAAMLHWRNSAPRWLHAFAVLVASVI